LVSSHVSWARDRAHTFVRLCLTAIDPLSYAVRRLNTQADTPRPAPDIVLQTSTPFITPPPSGVDGEPSVLSVLQKIKASSRRLGDGDPQMPCIALSGKLRFKLSGMCPVQSVRKDPGPYPKADPTLPPM
jgi:hypothetical protein